MREFFVGPIFPQEIRKPLREFEGIHGLLLARLPFHEKSPVNKLRRHEDGPEFELGRGEKFGSLFTRNSHEHF